LTVGVVGVLAVVTGLAVSGCSSDDEGAAGGDLSVDELLTESAATMAEVSSATFTIEQVGASVFIDEADQIAFQAAEGRYAAPASADALVTVEAFGLVTQVGAVAIDGTVWLTNPLTSKWMEAPEGFSFDPANLFDPELGIPAVLNEAVGNAELMTDGSGAAEAEDGAGVADGAADDRHHVRTTVSADRVSALTGGLVAVATDTDLWIDPDSLRVVEVRFDLPLGDQVSTWSLVVTSYDTEVAIEAPEVGATS
jgi:hypothetical protein